MKRNIRQTLLAPAAVLLLAAATLGMAGCTQGEDALPGADGNDIARTLNIKVGPKQGFNPGNADGSADNAPTTRSTVDEDTGVMSWQEGDRIFLTVNYTGVTPGTYCYTMVRTATDTWNFYNDYVGTHTVEGTTIDLSALTSFSAVQVPLGATGISTFKAQHTDSNTYVDNSGEVVLMDGGSRDYLMGEMTSPSMDADITLNLVHKYIACLRFPGGLTPGKKYYVDGLSIIQSIGGGGMVSSSKITPFTAALDGSLAICINATGSRAVTLKEADDDDDTTNDKVVYNATFSVEYGKNYRCIIPAAGGVNPGSSPDLLTPAPIVAGNTVWKVNGYYVTAPDADVSKKYQWAATTAATQMDTDPCAGKGNWRMPTMKDFETMAGWTTTHPWSQDANDYATSIASDKAALEAAFQDGDYWSSVARTSSDSQTWVMLWYGIGGMATYLWYDKTSSTHVRCVQPQ